MHRHKLTELAEKDIHNSIIKICLDDLVYTISDKDLEKIKNHFCIGFKIEAIEGTTLNIKVDINFHEYCTRQRKNQEDLTRVSLLEIINESEVTK